MKIYTIIAGVDGCGKTSLLGILQNVNNTIGVLADDVSIEECLEKEICFTQETTLSGKKRLPLSSELLKKIITFVCIM